MNKNNKMPSLIAGFSKELDKLNVNVDDITCSELILLRDFSILNLVLCVKDNVAELFAFNYDFKGEDWIVDELERFEMEESDNTSEMISHLWNIIGLSSSCEHNLNITPVSDDHQYSLIAYFRLNKMLLQQREAFQIKQAYVCEDYQKSGVGMTAYSYLREKLHTIVSDNLQTIAAMQLWLNKIAKLGQVEAWDLNQKKKLGQVFHRALDKSPHPIWGLSYASHKPTVKVKRRGLERQLEDLQDSYYTANVCQEKDLTQLVLAFSH